MEEKDLKRFFETIRKMNSGSEVSNDDLAFVLEYSPEISEEAIDTFVAADKNGTATKEQYRAAVIEWGKRMQSDPLYRERVVKLYTEQQGQKTTDRLTDGIGLVMAGTDIMNSIKQIRAGQQAAKASKKPGKPAIPQRDAMLQQALRNAEQGTFDSGRAVAAARAEIQDTYQNDLQNAKTASTGQAGAFGSYVQSAHNRKNKAALQLAPIQDQIRAREQQRYDNLLGMRMDETQNMFANQAALYPHDLNQYNEDQKSAGALQAQGRENLRYGLYNAGNRFAQNAGRMAAERRFRNLQNQVVATHGNELGEKMMQVERNLMKYKNPKWELNNPRDTYDSWQYNPNSMFS